MLSESVWWEPLPYWGLPLRAGTTERVILTWEHTYMEEVHCLPECPPLPSVSPVFHRCLAVSGPTSGMESDKCGTPQSKAEPGMHGDDI